MITAPRPETHVTPLCSVLPETCLTVSDDLTSDGRHGATTALTAQPTTRPKCEMTERALAFSFNVHPLFNYKRKVTMSDARWAMHDGCADDTPRRSR